MKHFQQKGIPALVLLDHVNFRTSLGPDLVDIASVWVWHDDVIQLVVTHWISHNVLIWAYPSSDRCFFNERSQVFILNHLISAQHQPEDGIPGWYRDTRILSDHLVTYQRLDAVRSDDQVTHHDFSAGELYRRLLEINVHHCAIKSDHDCIKRLGLDNERVM